MPFYKVPQPVHASSSGTVQQQQGQQQGQLMQEQLMQGQQQGKQQLQQRIWDSTSGLYKETSIPDGCGRGIVPGLVVPSPSDDLEDWSIRSTISDRSSSFADMTEVDRDSELLRRDLEHQIQRQTYGDNTSKKDSEITSKGRPRPKSCLIEQELEELRRRENEVSAMHQSLYHSQQMLSDHSSYPGDVTDKDSGISEDNNVEYSNRSHPASAGESRIVQELTEQRLRELELRGRWKQMGLIADNDDEEQIEPRQDPVVDGNRKQRPTAIVQPEVNRGIEQSRVHPFVGNEQFMENRMSYIPVEETPIEREIRMAREREEALRRSRGLPTTITSGTATGSTVNGREEETLKIEITPLDDAAIDGFQVAPSKMSMKKLANNRLQMEIQREKKREVALRTQGAIHTISEERAGEHKKYVEIIPPDCNQNSAKTFPCWMKNSNSKNSNLAESDAQLDGSGDSIVEGMNCSMSKDNPIKMGGAGIDRSGSDRGMTGKVRMNKQTIQDEHDRVLAEMNELAMRSRSLKSKSNSSEPPSAAERKMERELREMQNREEELRLQREMLNQGHPSN